MGLSIIVIEKKFHLSYRDFSPGLYFFQGFDYVTDQLTGDAPKVKDDAIISYFVGLS
jgi:hypothetical protein